MGETIGYEEEGKKLNKFCYKEISENSNINSTS